MRMLLMAVLGTVLWVGPGRVIAHAQPARHVEKEGGFSYVPPKGWKMYDGGSEAFAKTADATIDKQIQQIKQQLAKAPPGSAQAKALQQALDALQRIQKTTQDMAKIARETGFEDKFKGFMGSADKGPAATLSFTVANLSKMPKKMVDGKEVERTLDDVIASHKEPPITTSATERDSFRVVTEKKLKTDAGAEGVLLVTEIDKKGVRYRYTYYFLDLSEDRKLVTFGSAVAADNLDAVFEAAFKTLHVEKK
jgi:hypothetical protein